MLKFDFLSYSSIHCIYIATKYEIGVHMMENAICQYTLSYYHSPIHVFDQKKVFGELTSVWWRRRFSCGHGGRRRSGGEGDRLERRRWSIER
jgi:hypothetical protein